MNNVYMYNQFFKYSKSTIWASKLASNALLCLCTIALRLHTSKVFNWTILLKMKNSPAYYWRIFSSIRLQLIILLPGDPLTYNTYKDPM